MSYYELDVRQYESIINVVEQFSDGGEAEQVINEFLRTSGGDQIEQRIKELLPVSGRTWRGKKAAASSTNPFKKVSGNLSVTIRTKGGYHYLYFPDDGSDTEKHYGNQQFMFKGASDKSEEIGNQIIDKLLKRLEV